MALPRVETRPSFAEPTEGRAGFNPGLHYETPLEFLSLRRWAATEQGASQGCGGFLASRLDALIPGRGVPVVVRENRSNDHRLPSGNPLG